MNESTVLLNDRSADSDRLSSRNNIESCIQESVYKYFIQSGLLLQLSCSAVALCCKNITFIIVRIAGIVDASMFN